MNQMRICKNRRDLSRLGEPNATIRGASYGWRLALLCLPLFTACCGPRGVDDWQAIGPVEQVRSPTYAEVVTRYNEHVEPLDPVYAQTFIELYWREEIDGKPRDRKEIGGGKLIVRRPGDFALTIEKLGTIYLWAGANTEGRYWLIDRSGDVPVAMVGSVGLAAERFPLGIDPKSLPLLMGLKPIELGEQTESNPVWSSDRGWVIEPPGEQVRILIDRETGRPIQVNLMDDTGDLRIVSELDDLVELEVPGVRRLRGPRMPMNADIYAVGQDARLRLEIREADGDPGEIQDRWFEFEDLLPALGVDEADVRDLDAGE